MELKRYWEILLARKWAFALVFLTIAASAVVGTYSLPRSYEATAKIHVETSTTLSTLLNQLGVDTERTRSAPRGSEKYELIADDVVRATVRPLLRELISKLQLRDRRHDLIEPEELAKPKIKKLILPEPFIEVEQYEDTNILEITAISVYPEQAMMMANTLASFYIEDQIRQRRDEYESVRILIKEQINKEREKYFTELKKMREFGIRERVLDLNIQTENYLDRLSRLYSDYEDNALSIANSRYTIKTLETRLSRITEYRVASETIQNNELLQSLKNTLHGYMIELARLKAEFRPDHPAVIQVMNQIESTKSLIKNEAIKMFRSETREVDPLYDELISNLVLEYVSLSAKQAERDVIKRLIENREDSLADYPDKTMQYTQLKSDLSVSQSIYENLFSYLNQVDIAESITLSEIRFIDPASKPDTMDPYFPRKRLTIFLGLLIAAFWGLIFAFLIEYLDDSIHTADDLERDRSLVLLGTVPRRRELNRSTISQLDPRSKIVEAFRSVRNSIKHFKSEGRPGTLLITSPNRGDGKTTTAVNLGISISSEGKRVLLIDLDLRNPSIHKKLGLDNDTGIVDCLENDIPVKQMIRETDIRDLSVILCGRIPLDPARIIDSPRLKDIIHTLSVQYDTVIIDSPHFVPIIDAFVLGNYVDGLVVVIKAGGISTRLLKRIENRMKLLNLKWVGLIFIK